MGQFAIHVGGTSKNGRTSIVWYLASGGMMRRSASVLWMLLGLSSVAVPLGAQSPEGPIAPRPGVPVQQAPPEAQAKMVVRGSLENTPVTVPSAKGEMAPNLGTNAFRVTVKGARPRAPHCPL